MKERLKVVLIAFKISFARIPYGLVFRNFTIIFILCFAPILQTKSILAEEKRRNVKVGFFENKPLSFLDDQSVVQGIYPDVIRRSFIAMVEGLILWNCWVSSLLLDFYGVLRFYGIWKSWIIYPDVDRSFWNLYCHAWFGDEIKCHHSGPFLISFLILRDFIR